MQPEVCPMSPTLWTLLAVAVAFIGGAVCAFQCVEGAQCGDCAAKDRELDRLHASLDSTQHQVGHWITRAQRAEATVAEYVMREAEDKARDERIWRNVRREIANINREGGIAMELAAENDAEAAEAIYALWCAEEKPLGGGEVCE